mgnify:FL=1
MVRLNRTELGRLHPGAKRFIRDLRRENRDTHNESPALEVIAVINGNDIWISRVERLGAFSLDNVLRDAEDHASKTGGEIYIASVTY